MSKDFHIPSLAQHFDPPHGYLGHFGWVVGFSADAEFMNNAIERFTGLTRHRRASEGRIALALFLDPHNPPVSLADAPGVAHLPFANLDLKPCKLVHAKVALLGFRGVDPEHQGNWCVRLLISTGNWTQQTLEESLDIAWAVEVCGDRLTGADDETKAACADIKAANGLMQWLRHGAGGLFDVRLLQATQKTKDEQTAVSGWISECVKKARGIPPRFFDNRNEPMLVQLPKLVKETREARRNYLALGSGFYEGVTASVPQKIIRRLRHHGLLTQGDTDIDLFVNPSACQSIAESVSDLASNGIKVRQAKAPELLFGPNSLRSLHAKFIFSANCRDDSNQCSSAWIYLGSGNLTSPGFERTGKEANLEAGVVFGVNGLVWNGGRGIEPKQVVTNLLPIQWNASFESNDCLEAGKDWNPDAPTHFAPPIPWLVWRGTGPVDELCFPDDTSAIVPFVILDNSGNEVQETSRTFTWSGDQPQQVRSRWVADGNTREAYIPVIDGLGRIAARKLQPLSIEDAWWQLADFPNPPDVDNLDEDDETCKVGNTWSANATNEASMARYPIRQMMELVEQIAAKQIEITKHDWALWCRRLEQTLVQAKGSPVVVHFKTLGLNPIAPLRHAPFRPDYAEDASSDPGREYEAVLETVEKSWEVDKLASLGSING